MTNSIHDDRIAAFVRGDVMTFYAVVGHEYVENDDLQELRARLRAEYTSPTTLSSMLGGLTLHA
jgi:hypothetical protein